jgi:formylmethanofuran--tetrahydromethanopterin N-formyltransferase
MQLGATEIVDTFAEAFEMWASRVLITADSPEWAMAAAQSMTGFATSVIRCKCEAAVERPILADDTPDLRPGVAVLLFAMDLEGLGKRLIERIGQCVMTCPTTACYCGLDSETRVPVGNRLRFFGDGYQIGKRIAGRRFWRVPVMEGEFIVDDVFGAQPAVGGGNILISAHDARTALRAAVAAADAMRKVPGVILPFPQGVVRCGSKPGSKYKGLIASTNDPYCPTLRAFAPQSSVPEQAHSVYEIVIDGLNVDVVEQAMRDGTKAAAAEGALQVSAGNYGGNLGKYRIDLHRALAA